MLKPIFLEQTASEWLSMLETAGIPCGPINTLDKVFAEPQVEAREMLIDMEHSEIGDLRLVGSPLKFSETPVEYKLPPPRLGEHTEEVLKELLGYSAERIRNCLSRLSLKVQNYIQVTRIANLAVSATLSRLLLSDDCKRYCMNHCH